MKLLIADDHDLLREALSAFLEREQDIEVFLAADFNGALTVVAHEGPFDLVLLDIDMPGMDGIAGLLRMKEAAKAPVGIISGLNDRSFIEAALKQGAAGFMPKTMGAKSMAHAVRFMAAGEVFAPASLMTAEPVIVVDDTPSLLTERESQVLRFLADGMSNKEIGRELDLQEVTIKLHVKTLTQKLKAKNRTHAAVIGRDLGLI